MASPMVHAGKKGPWPRQRANMPHQRLPNDATGVSRRTREDSQVAPASALLWQWSAEANSRRTCESSRVASVPPAAVAEQLLRSNRRLRRLSEKVHRRQERLRQVLTASGLKMYAELEAASKECLSELIDAVWDAATRQRRLAAQTREPLEQSHAAPQSHRPSSPRCPTATSGSASSDKDYQRVSVLDHRARMGGGF